MKNSNARLGRPAVVFEGLLRRLQGDLLDGTFGDGAYLPGERELSERYGASRKTVRSVLTRLEQRGQIASEPGRGWRVRGSEAGTRVPASRSILLIGTDKPRHRLVLEAARQRLDEAGWDSRVDVYAGDGARFLETVELAGTAGVLCYRGKPLPASFVRRVAAQGARLVVAGDESQTEHDTVAVNQRHGFALLVDALARRGHKRIALVSSNKLILDPGFVSAEYGYTDGMRKHGLTPEVLHLEETVLDGPEHAHPFLEWLRDLCDKRRRPTCIIPAAAFLLRSLVALLQSQGIRVPGDMEVTGFLPELRDDGLHDLGIEQMLALEDPLEALGQTAAQRLLVRLGDDPSPPGLTFLSPRLLTCHWKRRWTLEDANAIAAN